MERKCDIPVKRKPVSKKTFKLMVLREYDGEGKIMPARLYDICEHFINQYSKDIYESKDHPVHKIRELCREILEMRK